MTFYKNNKTKYFGGLGSSSGGGGGGGNSPISSVDTLFFNIDATQRLKIQPSVLAPEYQKTIGGSGLQVSAGYTTPLSSPFQITISGALGLSQGVSQTLSFTSSANSTTYPNGYPATAVGAAAWWNDNEDTINATLAASASFFSWKIDRDIPISSATYSYSGNVSGTTPNVFAGQTPAASIVVSGSGANTSAIRTTLYRQNPTEPSWSAAVAVNAGTLVENGDIGKPPLLTINKAETTATVSLTVVATSQVSGATATASVSFSKGTSTGGLSGIGVISVSQTMAIQANQVGFTDMGLATDDGDIPLKVSSSSETIQPLDTQWGQNGLVNATYVNRAGIAGAIAFVGNSSSNVNKLIVDTFLGDAASPASAFEVLAIFGSSFYSLDNLSAPQDGTNGNLYCMGSDNGGNLMIVKMTFNNDLNPTFYRTPIFTIQTATGSLSNIAAFSVVNNGAGRVDVYVSGSTAAGGSSQNYIYRATITDGQLTAPAFALLPNFVATNSVVQICCETTTSFSYQTPAKWHDYNITTNTIRDLLSLTGSAGAMFYDGTNLYGVDSVGNAYLIKISGKIVNKNYGKYSGMTVSGNSVPLISLDNLGNPNIIYWGTSSIGSAFIANYVEKIISTPRTVLTGALDVNSLGTVYGLSSLQEKIGVEDVLVFRAIVNADIPITTSFGDYSLANLTVLKNDGSFIVNANSISFSRGGLFTVKYQGWVGKISFTAGSAFAFLNFDQSSQITTNHAAAIFFFGAGGDIISFYAPQYMFAATSATVLWPSYYFTGVNSPTIKAGTTIEIWERKS